MAGVKKTFLLCTADLYWLFSATRWCSGTVVFFPWELWACGFVGCFFF